MFIVGFVVSAAARIAIPQAQKRVPEGTLCICGNSKNYLP